MWGVWSASQAPSQFSSSGSVPIKRLTESYIFDSFLDASSLSNYIATARTVVASGSHSWTSSESSKSFLKAKASHMRMRLTKLLHSTKMWSCSLARNLQRVNVGGTSVIPWIMVWLSVFLQQLNKPFVCVCASACVCACVCVWACGVCVWACVCAIALTTQEEVFTMCCYLLVLVIKAAIIVWAAQRWVQNAPPTGFWRIENEFPNSAKINFCGYIEWEAFLKDVLYENTTFDVSKGGNL